VASGQGGLGGPVIAALMNFDQGILFRFVMGTFFSFFCGSLLFLLLSSSLLPGTQEQSPFPFFIL